MEPGDLVDLIGTIRVSAGGKSWVEYKPGKDRGFVALYIGDHSLKKPAKRADIVRVLNHLGIVLLEQIDEREAARMREAGVPLPDASTSLANGGGT